MGSISYVFLLFCALFWPTHQLLLVPDSCGVSLNPFTRAKCDNAGGTRDSCIQQGCCFDDSPAASCSSSQASKTRCFKPASCTVDKSARTECGWAGISRAQCQCRGCCFDSTATGNAAACFEPASDTDVCQVQTLDETYIANNNDKEIRGISAEECKSRCKAEKEFVCKTADYNKKIRRCYLSRLSFADAEEKTLVRRNRNKDFILYTMCDSTPAATSAPTSASTCDWKRFEGERIHASGSEYKEVKNIANEAECKTTCENYQAFKCQVFVYFTSTQRCLVSELSYDLVEEQKRLRPATATNPSVLFGCPSVKAPLEKVNVCEWEQLDNSYIRDTNKKEIENEELTNEECKEKCETDKEFACKSFYIHLPKKRCYLSKISPAKAKNEGLMRLSNDYVLFGCPTKVSETVDPDCKNRKVDMVIAFDESNSVSPNDFKQIKTFMEELVKLIPIAPQMSHIAMVSFATYAKVVFKFSQGQRMEMVLGYIKKLNQTGGETETHLALQLANDLLAKSKRKSDSQKVVVLLTDGKSSEKELTQLKAKVLRDQGVLLIAIGVGSEANLTELQGITGNINQTHMVSDFSKLRQIANKIPGTACKGAPIAPESVATDDVPSAICTTTSNYKMCQDIPESQRTNFTSKDPVGRPYFMIDSDGPEGKVCPFRVACDFGKSIPETIIANVGPEEVCVTRCTESAAAGSQMSCNVQPMKYSSSIFQARQMTTNANWCRQDVEITTRRFAVSGNVHLFMKNSKIDFPCENGKCNSDANGSAEKTDKGTLTDSASLPVESVSVNNVNDDNQKACYKVGDLICE